jgi:beta-glucosidase
MKQITVKLFICSQLIFLCTGMVAQSKKDAFRNTKLSIDVRVKDLVSKLTLEEKVKQMMENAPAIDRLKIPAYNWWNEALHGVARSGDTVTVFPQAIGMAAGFDTKALKRMGDITSDEARVIYHQSFKNGKLGNQYKGLTFWTPNINIFRDPRWGRGHETYGEDPYLTGQMGMSIVRGLQGSDPKYLKSSACAKHFAVHSGPERGRHEFDSQVTDVDLYNTYLPAFRNLVVDAKVTSVMCAYNRLNGEPCCGSNRLLDKILRKDWGFTGYIVSDCGAINDFWSGHKTHADKATAAVDAVKLTTDLECGEWWKKLWSYASLEQAVKDGLIDEKKLDESLSRLFKLRFQMGMFDTQSNVPYSKLPASVVNSPAHQQHALKMARQSMVLLKNDGILPLSKSIRTIALIGPNADDKDALLGNYNGIPQNPITPLKGIRSKVSSNTTIIYRKAINYVKPIENEAIETTVTEASKADVIIYVGGISAMLEGEDGDVGKEQIAGFLGGDRTTIALPSIQTELMKKLKATGKPLVFVNMSGSAMSINWENENVNAIVQAWYGGQSAGTAIADVLFGDYNPSGRLPVTFYKSENDIPSFFDYGMTGRTYRYFKGEPLYPFGYGLSYTQFNYAIAELPKSSYTANETIRFSIKVSNEGMRSGDDVVQAYVRYPNHIDLPIKELKAFKRINLLSKKSKVVQFEIPIAELKKWNTSKNDYDLFTGEYELYIGSHSDDKRIISNFKI